MMRNLLIIITLTLVLPLTFVSCDNDNNSNDQEPLPGAEDPMGGSGFDLDTAIELMFLSIEAYQMLADAENFMMFSLPEPYTLVEQITTNEGFTSETISMATPIAFIATKDDNVYVVFRGTKTISEWMTDADFPFVPYVDPAGGMTEKGFTDLYEAIESQIIPVVTMLNGQGTFNNLYVTGHSLGAALAVVATPDLLMKTGFENPTMYNFAGPRVGDSEFKTFYEAFSLDSWRVFNTNDLVPKLPPELLGYTHVESGFSVTFGDAIDLIEDHSSCNYYNTLCEMLTGGETAIMDCKLKIKGLDDCNTDL